jgi:hypothetical protein
MIVFELICPERHRFEGWFASARDFDGQKAAGLISCPVCSRSGVEKLLTAKIAKTDAARQSEANVSNVKPTSPEGREKPSFHDIIDFILANTENVGKAFPVEARRIHYKDAPHRNIRGVATPEETQALLDEGIDVVPLPLPPREEWN